MNDNDRDTESSASRQHYVDTGHYLRRDGSCECDDDTGASSTVLAVGLFLTVPALLVLVWLARMAAMVLAVSGRF